MHAKCTIIHTASWSMNFVSSQLGLHQSSKTDRIRNHHHQSHDNSSRGGNSSSQQRPQQRQQQQQREQQRMSKSERSEAVAMMILEQPLKPPNGMSDNSHCSGSRESRRSLISRRSLNSKRSFRNGKQQQQHPASAFF